MVNSVELNERSINSCKIIGLSYGNALYASKGFPCDMLHCQAIPARASIPLTYSSLRFTRFPREGQRPLLGTMILLCGGCETCEGNRLDS